VWMLIGRMNAPSLSCRCAIARYPFLVSFRKT
jgi:hypothetical protein